MAANGVAHVFCRKAEAPQRNDDDCRKSGDQKAGNCTNFLFHDWPIYHAVFPSGQLFSSAPPHAGFRQLCLRPLGVRTRTAGKVRSRRYRGRRKEALDRESVLAGGSHGRSCPVANVFSAPSWRGAGAGSGSRPGCRAASADARRGSGRGCWGWPGLRAISPACAGSSGVNNLASPN